MTPVSFAFVAAGMATQTKGILYRLQPSRTGQSPDWNGRGGAIATRDVPTPITDKSYWEGRYVLCELTLCRNESELLVINDAVCAVSRTKNIVTTQMVGMDGTVKEYINEGDYQINIVVGVAAVRNGVIVDEYPEEGLRELSAFLDEKAAIKVHSAFLEIFDIGSIVIKSFSVTQDTASNYQSVSISAVSDGDYNVYSTEY
nr:MAG TPA: hypothetical protein [Caudoviricetes sp.]